MLISICCHLLSVYLLEKFPAMNNMVFRASG